jgi:hypothetical protein
MNLGNTRKNKPVRAALHSPPIRRTVLVPRLTPSIAWRGECGRTVGWHKGPSRNLTLDLWSTDDRARPGSVPPADQALRGGGEAEDGGRGEHLARAELRRREVRIIGCVRVALGLEGERIVTCDRSS